MRFTRTLGSALFIGVVLAASGCTDLPLTPEVPVTVLSAGKTDNPKARNINNQNDNGNGNGSGQVGDGLVHVMEWFTPLKADEVVSAVIGPLGGKIQLHVAGFQLKVPPGALVGDVRITVTAKAGTLVGYEFQPHGLQFLIPAVAQQNARNLAAPNGRGSKSSVFAAYYEGSLLPQVKALEILGIEFSGGTQSFLIHHFSGYVIATD